MKDQTSISRRALVKSSVFGLVAASIPNIAFSKEAFGFVPDENKKNDLFHRYPSIDDKIVAEVVGVSHFNLDRLKELVNPRPELARATWDWGFGDWESALGAASHVGRRDIAEFLMSKGARPDLFTYAMLGGYDTVKAMIETTPGIQTIAGPHGITLLQHAKNGLQSDGLTAEQKNNSNKLISYLEKIGNADVQPVNIEMPDTEKEKYLGEYMYGDGTADGFSVKLNTRKMISLGKLGKFGGALYQKSANLFTYNGAPSVEIVFEIKLDKVLSLTVHEPNLTLTARKI